MGAETQQTVWMVTGSLITTPRAGCVTVVAGILYTRTNSADHLHAQITMAVLLGCYIAVRDRGLRGQPTATWHGWGMEALQGWPTYLRWGGWGRQQRSTRLPT